MTDRTSCDGVGALERRVGTAGGPVVLCPTCGIALDVDVVPTATIAPVPFHLIDARRNLRAAIARTPPDVRDAGFLLV